MVHLKYKIWFALKLEIENFTGDVFDVCDLVPSAKCRQNLDTARLIVKKQPNLLTHLIEVVADGPAEDQPLYPPVETVVYRYNLVAKGMRLFQLTNINSLDPAHYQFSVGNTVSNKIGPVLYTNRAGESIANGDRVFTGTFDEAGPGVLGVITIYQNNLLPADYRLQDGAGKCREPVYTIRFAKHS
jgi:hypothetical protein